MSIFCEGRGCPRAKDCIRNEGWEDFRKRFHKEDEQEGFATGVWFIKEQDCIESNYQEGAFYDLIVSKVSFLIYLKGLDSILSHYGIRNQIRKFAEEAYELQEAVIEQETAQETLQEFTEQKGNFDNEHIAEELADVMVLWMQIRMHYNVNIGKIEGIVNDKIKRQIKRIENETSYI